jgi:sorbitol/mannitol transport system permease protein
MREIPREILESARLDGATVKQQLLHLLLPLCLPGICSTALLLIVSAASLLAIGPILLVGLLTQRTFVRGLHLALCNDHGKGPRLGNRKKYANACMVAD